MLSLLMGNLFSWLFELVLVAQEGSFDASTLSLIAPEPVIVFYVFFFSCSLQAFLPF